MHQLKQDGFEIVNSVFTREQVKNILQVIDQCDKDRSTFRRSEALFAIRQFLTEIPEVYPLIFTTEFIKLIQEKAGEGYELVKSIYFDKPAQSNWFVSYHQDLTIAVKEKIESSGFGSWTVKEDQFAVRPPVSILEDNVTVRIHLDNTTDENGALKVIPESHKNGIIKYSMGEGKGYESEALCTVEQGGVMFMKPLLLHSSGRTINNARRRVIHLEFSRESLPEGMKWAEKIIHSSSI